MRIVVLVTMFGCATEPMPMHDSPDEIASPEITGEQVDPLHGRCTGVVGDNGWARCSGRCAPLGELACASAAGCRIAYSDDTNTPGEEHAFRSCLDVAVGAVRDVPCRALDAVACSQRSDCTALHFGLYAYAPFKRCDAEGLEVLDRNVR